MELQINESVPPTTKRKVSEAAKKAQKKWRAEHADKYREKCRQYSASYYERHHEEVLDRRHTKLNPTALECSTIKNPDIVSAEIVPDRPKKEESKPRMIVRGIYTKEIVWVIPKGMDLEDEKTYSFADKWGTLYITNLITGEETELNGEELDCDCKYSQNRRIEEDTEGWWSNQADAE